VQEEIIAEYERKARAGQAHERCLKPATLENLEIRDVYDVLQAAAAEVLGEGQAD
jgi:hypothetical protein